MSSEDLTPFLAPTKIVDSDHPNVQRFAREHGRGGSPTECVVRLYYAVRDGLRYEPYEAILTPEGLRASYGLEIRKGWCVSKAVLLAAGCRALGIPARLGFADVRNHLSTQRLRETMKTDIFHWHGYTSILLKDQWVKATPAFNIELCEKFGLKPLEFDGKQDSIYHPFDRSGNKHMEYLKDRGEFADVPLGAMLDTFREEYPDMANWTPGGDFAAEAANENEATLGSRAS